MSAASNYLENEVLDHILGKGTRDFASPVNLYVALFTGVEATVLANLEAGTLTDEVANSFAYARTAVSFDAASGGATSNTAQVSFPAASGGDWGTVTVQAIIDGSIHGAGDVIFASALTVAKTVTDGDTFQMAAGALDVTMA